MTTCTLLAGGTGVQRETTIVGLIDATLTTAVILEGLHTGTSALGALTASPALVLTTIAVGCPCCNTGLVMRVTLDRLLRQRPAHLYISLADASHLPHLQQFLSAPPYTERVSLTPAIICPS